MKTAKFNIGDVVVHTKQGYRAVIVDIDPIFQASGRLNPRAQKEAFAIRNPWYRLLVDDSSHMTYVEECHLSEALNRDEINNPKVTEFLNKAQLGYMAQRKSH